ncbi:MAG TPA: hypothetical protein VHS09_14935 [Polyangiaceae bacterium]|jgi:hypothetical protein|nr:hypothetical protein [Polyangiaceae bacterium]
MTQTTVSPLRGRARVLAFAVAGIAAVSLAYACVQTKRSPGDECLKSEDCLSGICSQLVCASPGPLTDDTPTNSEAGELDSGAGADTSVADTSAADTFSAADTSSSSETGGEAGEASSGD